VGGGERGSRSERFARRPVGFCTLLPRARSKWFPRPAAPAVGVAGVLGPGRLPFRKMGLRAPGPPADARVPGPVRFAVRSRTAAHEDESQRALPDRERGVDRAPRRGLHLAGGARRPRLDASRRQHPRRRRQARSPRASAAGRARGAGSRRFRRRARAAPGRLCDRGEYAGGPLAAARSRLDRHSTETGPRRADRPSHPAAIRFAAQGGSVDVPGAPPAPPESPGA